MIKQSRRRARFRTANRGKIGGPWDTAPSDTGKRLPKQRSTPMSEIDSEFAERRSEINRLIEDHDLDGAARRYRDLMRDAPESVLGEDRQLDIASQLYAQSDHEHAAAAYELFLDRYPGSRKASEVSLILGVLYTRKLQEPKRAREMIERAQGAVLDPAQSTLADELLAELDS
jgi:TolA-binding protein